MIAFLLYLASIAEGFKTLFVAAGIILLVVGGVGFFNYVGLIAIDPYIHENPTESRMLKLYSKIFKIAATIGSIAIFSAILIPKKDDIYIIAGAYYSEKAVVSFVNSDEMKKVGKVINLELDKRIKELSGEKENVEKDLEKLK